jgi:hypothetical protein
MILTQEARFTAFTRRLGGKWPARDRQSDNAQIGLCHNQSGASMDRAVVNSK